MIRVKFIIEDVKVKARSFTNSVYFDELDEVTMQIIEAQRVHLKQKNFMGTNTRIFCLIENLEEKR
jgi:hypothetical protein